MFKSIQRKRRGTMKSTDKENNPDIYHNKAKTIKRKLKEGANPNYIRDFENENKLPALSYAVYNNHVDVINICNIFISDHRTNINATDNYLRTPLMYICDDYVTDEIGSELVSILLEHPELQLNQKNIFGQTALQTCCIHGRSLCVSQIVDDIRVDINHLDNLDQSALYHAILNGSLECVKALLSCPYIDPNVFSRGETPLHLAHRLNKTDIVEELLKDGRTSAYIADHKGFVVADEIDESVFAEFLTQSLEQDFDFF